MKARSVGIVVALGVLVALALPGGAVAKPGHYKTKSLSTEQFQLHGSNDYTLDVAVVNRRAQLIIHKAIGHGGLSVAYFLRGKLSPGPDLHFPIGDEGEVNLHFVPRGRPEETPLPGCKGGPQVIEEGTLVGTVRFRGRDGFTTVDTHRAHVIVARVPSMTCREVETSTNIVGVGLPASGGEVPDGMTRLIAGSRPGNQIFGASLLGEEGVICGGEFPGFSASISRREGGAEMASSAFVAGVPSNFRIPGSLDPPATTTVEPPAPFSGSASFSLTAPRHAEWSGDLAVVLPGYGRVPLTGPSVKAALCEGETCTPTLPKSLRPRSGGSDSEGYLDGSYYTEGEAAS
jgi:hypothetical protein